MLTETWAELCLYAGSRWKARWFVAYFCLWVAGIVYFSFWRMP